MDVDFESRQIALPHLVVLGPEQTMPQFPLYKKGIIEHSPHRVTVKID